MGKESINLEIKTSPSRNQRTIEQSPTREGSVGSCEEEGEDSKLTEDEPAPREAPCPYDLSQKP